MRLTKTCFQKSSYCLRNQEFQKWQSVALKVGNTKVFGEHWTKSDHKHLTRSHS